MIGCATAVHCVRLFQFLQFFACDGGCIPSVTTMNVIARQQSSLHSLAAP